MTKRRIIVVGGGPAGMMAAIRAAQLGADVTLLEKNAAPGAKLLLTGKGRCNLTNQCDLESFLKRFSGRSEFLRDAFKKFFHPELMEFFETRGLKLKVERQERVFPATDKAQDVVEVLLKELKKNHVKINYRTAVKILQVKDGKIAGILTSDGQALEAEKIILATGGVSYPFTGSTGDGLKMAEALGHSVVPLRAGLVPLEVEGKIPQALEGLTLKNIRLTFQSGKKKWASEIGELLFTATGISGPLVLSMSGEIVDWLAEKKPVTVEIDLKPALAAEVLEERFLREFREAPKKTVKNILKNFLPLRMIDLFIRLAGIGPEISASQATKEKRARLISLLKGFRLNISGAKPIEAAMVTQGGVSLKEINPRTLESRILPGLYFAGEMIDVDADTGGFNLQSAFSTGYLAGESAAMG